KIPFVGWSRGSLCRCINSDDIGCSYGKTCLNYFCRTRNRSLAIKRCQGSRACSAKNLQVGCECTGKIRTKIVYCNGHTSSGGREFIPDTVSGATATAWCWSGCCCISQITSSRGASAGWRKVKCPYATSL